MMLAPVKAIGGGLHPRGQEDEDEEEALLYVRYAQLCGEV
jgi:hypothetical protein